MLAFVQFPHPKDEAKPDRKTRSTYDWNCGKHHRRFMQASGAYTTSGDSSESQSGEFCFWGEWEGHGRCVEQLNSQDRESPNYLCKPILSRPPKDRTGLQNTDPLVFGERFRYSNCRQYSGKCQTQLRNLEPGSVILYGSTFVDRFVLDTVFVVSDKRQPWRTNREFPRNNELIDDILRDTTLKPLQNKTCSDTGGDYQDLVIYGGVTYAERENYGGMFSFVPAQLCSNGTIGFKRPTIQLDGIVNPESTRAARYNKDVIRGDKEKIHQLWREVADQVVTSDLLLAHFLSPPERKDL
ncbi:MAG: hypothetical protein H6616_17950 [Ignavibacteria bacterium]|nr:hypothetical protein [Ignavibacteria bacterium]